ncbi:MAG: helix-turn-helix domain-containing protein [Nitrospirae bacterium]|nr:helix-turn-helix domain-containing protein [Candidatus Troglogloeales bacterium]MBI3597894.1 helix-turn-helix domain-containing protein [Candidatus Troglogloeales bacterium]
MKRIENQDYYQILEVPYKASWGEIQKAYELAKTTYSKGAMASYSLFDFTERGRILDKIEEAYHVLSHPEKRRKYDQALASFIPESASVPWRPNTPNSAPPLSPPAPIVHTETGVVTSATVTKVAVENEIVTGQTLKLLREKKGVSLQEISERTRINISYLELIESNSYGSLPAPVYMMSYLKQYAKIIALDSTIMEEYMKGYQRWCDSPRQR